MTPDEAVEYAEHLDELEERAALMDELTMFARSVGIPVEQVINALSEDD